MNVKDLGKGLSVESEDKWYSYLVSGSRQKQQECQINDLAFMDLTDCILIWIYIPQMREE